MYQFKLILLKMNCRDCGRGWIVLFCFMPKYDDFLHAKGNDKILSRTEMLHVLINLIKVY